MDIETVIEKLWTKLFIETGKTGYEDRIDYVLSSLGYQWSFETAVVSIINNKGHYCCCSRLVNSYYVFSSRDKLIHIGECCLGKITKDESCRDKMEEKTMEIKEIITSSRKLHKETYTAVYRKRAQRL